MCTPNIRTAFAGGCCLSWCIFPFLSGSRRPRGCCTLLMVGQPCWSKFYWKYAHPHFGGFRAPPVHLTISLHSVRFCCACNRSNAWFSWVVPFISIVSSAYASISCVGVMVFVGFFIARVHELSWYTRIIPSDWVVYRSAASPVPWLATYHGDSGENVLCSVEVPWACFTKYLWSFCICACNQRYCMSAPLLWQAREWHASTILSKHALRSLSMLIPVARISLIHS